MIFSIYFLLSAHITFSLFAKINKNANHQKSMIHSLICKKCTHTQRKKTLWKPVRHACCRRHSFFFCGISAVLSAECKIPSDWICEGPNRPAPIHGWIWMLHANFVQKPNTHNEKKVCKWHDSYFRIIFIHFVVSTCKHFKFRVISCAKKEPTTMVRCAVVCHRVLSSNSYIKGTKWKKN